MVHLITSLVYLHEYIPDVRHVHIIVANQHVVKCQGVGSIIVHTNVNGIDFVKNIKNVWFIPEFGHSLFSPQQLQRYNGWYACGKNDDKND
jgi:hypothetical protein